jgi:hypothetical protein
MNKTPKSQRQLTRNMIARAMIMQGRSTHLRDRRNRRPKDARRKQEEFGM